MKCQITDYGAECQNEALWTCDYVMGGGARPRVSCDSCKRKWERLYGNEPHLARRFKPLPAPMRLEFVEYECITSKRLLETLLKLHGLPPHLAGVPSDAPIYVPSREAP